MSYEEHIIIIDETFTLNLSIPNIMSIDDFKRLGLISNKIANLSD